MASRDLSGPDDENPPPLIPVLLESPSKEIESLIDMGDDGLLMGQLQSAFRQERDEEASDLLRSFGRVHDDHEVVSESGQVEIGRAHV